MHPHLIIPALATCLLLSSCVNKPKQLPRQITGESLVLIGETPGSLIHTPSPSLPVSVRSTYLPSENTTTYTEGEDYLIDRSKGTIHRTPASRIPDFSTNTLHGQQNFDHSKFPGFGNTDFFVFVDYSHPPAPHWPEQPSQIHLLTRTFEKLNNNQSVKIIAYGDSITAGGDATRPSLIFWQRWADALQAKYPEAPVTIINAATGGDSTRQGIERLDSKVLSQNPDLVILGFGMNDHNVNGVPIAEFARNLTSIIDRIRQATGADVLLFSAFPPNPDWRFGSHQMERYAQATANVATKLDCAYADVFNNWQQIAGRKKPEDLLGNNINHPNDFGHWIYYQVLAEAAGLCTGP